MLDLLSDFFTSFVLGLLTPLTAVCVLPLYPGFLVYLSAQLSGGERKVGPLVLSLVVAAGVLTFMLLVGLIFTSLLQVSLTQVIGIISPIAFLLLSIISLFLILDIDFTGLIPQVRAPSSRNPLLSAFLFGFFFGAVVIPCNPLFIAALFTKSVLNPEFLTNIVNFLFFGLGISFPLIALSLLSEVSSRSLIKFLSGNKRMINLVSGILMLVISLYYLIFVFEVQKSF